LGDVFASSLLGGIDLDLRYPVTRYLYRPLSIPTASVLARTPISPLTVTWVSAALAVGGAIAFGLRAYVLGAILTFVGVVADCADGDLARMTGRTSRSGAFLDSVLDRWTDAAMVLGLGLSDVDRYLTAAGFALVGSLLTSYARARAQSLGVDAPDGIGGRDLRILILIVAALWGNITAGLVAVAVAGGITSIQRTIAGARGLHRLDRDEARDLAGRAKGA
jgi:phosphatidylglycerophosphate synthase